MLIDPQSWRTPDALVQSLQLENGEPEEPVWCKQDQLHVTRCQIIRYERYWGTVAGVNTVPPEFFGHWMLRGFFLDPSLLGSSAQGWVQEKEGQSDTLTFEIF